MGGRRPRRVGGSIASRRSRIFWLLRMAVTEAVATPRPTLLEATAAPSPPRRTARPSEAPEISTAAATRATTTSRAVPKPPMMLLEAQYPASPR